MGDKYPPWGTPGGTSNVGTRVFEFSPNNDTNKWWDKYEDNHESNGSTNPILSSTFINMLW